MIDLSTKYLGLTLKNPIIAASSGLTSNINNIKKLESNGAAAIVLKSLFEEEILQQEVMSAQEAKENVRQELRQAFTRAAILSNEKYRGVVQAAWIFDGEHEGIR